MSKFLPPAPRNCTLWSIFLALAILIGAQPAHAVCLNNQVAWPSGYGVRDAGLYLSFNQVNNPPQYCYEWKVKYTGVDWPIYSARGDGCKNMSDNSFTLEWETLKVSMTDPGDTGNFEIRARSSVPSCGYVGTWSNWKAHTFTVPDSDSD